MPAPRGRRRDGGHRGAATPVCRGTPEARSAIERAWFQAHIDQTIDSSLLKRYGTLDEQAATICFLASDEASYITGTVLPVKVETSGKGFSGKGFQSRSACHRSGPNTSYWMSAGGDAPFDQRARHRLHERDRAAQVVPGIVGQG